MNMWRVDVAGFDIAGRLVDYWLFGSGYVVAITRRMAMGMDRWKMVEKCVVGADRKGSAKTG
jgi:hypothetical protein